MIFIYLRLQYLNMQQQSQRQLGQSTLPQKNNELDIQNLECLQDNPSWLAKFLCLHHLKLVFRYMRQGVNNKNIFKYNQDYQQFIPTTRLRDLAMKRHEFGEDFSGFLTLLKTQGWAIALVIALSMLTSAATTATIYYQQTLIQKIILQVSNQQYKYFGLIVGIVVFRFLVYNYLISLASNVALNIRVNLENFYMRIIFMVNNDDFNTNLYKFRFLDIESIIEAVIFMPYMLISFCTIIGIIVLVFLLDATYGFIVFGIFLFSFGLMTLLMIVIYRQLCERQDTKTEITKKSKYLFYSLASMLFQNLTTRLLKTLVDQKSKFLKEDRYINRAYILSQFVADSAVIVPIIIYYGLYYNGGSDLTLKNTYLTAVYLGMVYFPFKLLVYGAYFMVKGAQNYQSIMKDFRTIDRRRLKDLNSNVYSLNHHSYFDDLGDCFKYDYEIFHMARLISKKSLVEQMHRVSRGEPPLQKKITSAPNLQALPVNQESNVITLCSYFECEGQLDDYLNKLEVQIPKSCSLAVIDQTAFLMPESFLENILLYNPLTQQAKEKIEYVLRLVDLGHLTIQAFNEHKTKLNEATAKFYGWHESRIQLARALFHNVDYLIIRKYNLVRDTILMKRVLAQRQKEKKVTIIVNRNNFQLLKVPGQIMLFTPHSKIVHTSDQIFHQKQYFWNEILKRIGNKVINDKAVADHIKQEYLNLGPVQPIEYNVDSSAYKKFFSLVHPGGFLVVLLVLTGPPCFKFYMSYLVGQSLSINIYITYLIFAVVYICFILVRGLVLTGYLKVGSLELFAKFIDKMGQLKVFQIINFYKTKDVSLQSDFRKIDSQFFMNFQLGVTSALQGFVAIIIVSVGQPIYLAIALPVTIMSMVVNVFYTKIYNSLQALKQKHMISVRSYVNACTSHSFQLFRYRKYEAVEKRFHELNRISILFAANEIWILSGMRMLGEIIFIIGLVIFLIIMIETQANKISNLPMVSLGVSLFLSLNFSYRFSIKTFSIIQTQLVALSKIFVTIEKPKDDYYSLQNAQKKQSQKLKNTIDQYNQLTILEGFHTLTFRDVSIDIGGKQTQKINFTLKRGDRVAISYDSRLLAGLICGALNPKIYGKPRRKGQIICNNHFFIENSDVKVIFLQDEPLLPIKGTVYEACAFLKNTVQKNELRITLQTFFRQIGVNPIFNADTAIESMPLPHKQILSIFKVVYYQEFEILILFGGLQDVSILIREQIQDFLIRSNIPILISVTNLLSIVDRYHRYFLAQNMKLIQVRSITSERKLKFFDQERQQNPQDIHFH